MGDLLIRRAFAKPPGPFVDGELIEALEKADHAAQAPARPAAGTSVRQETGGAAGRPADGRTPSARADASKGATPPAAAAADRAAPQIDIRV